MPKAVDTAVSDCRLVRYGVYHPMNGWVAHHESHFNGRFETVDYVRWANEPVLFESHGMARSWSERLKAQLVTFDVTPCLRSWPGEEPQVTR